MGTRARAAVPAPLLKYEQSNSALLHCAETVTTTSGAVPLAVDFGYWKNPTSTPKTQRVPALIMAFPDLSDDHDVDVYVVAPDCGPSSI